MYGYRVDIRSAKVRCKEDEARQPQTRHGLASAIMRKAEMEGELAATVTECELTRQSPEISHTACL